MAVSFVASSVWAASTGSVTPTLPAGAVVGDLNVLALVSKYDDAMVQTLPGPPWTDHGAVANTGRSAGVDSGNLRTRAWSGVHDGSPMPTLDPTPNNVSVAHVTGYRVAAGKAFDVTAEPVKDDTPGTPLTLTAGSTLGLTAGDVLHIDLAINGDAATFGTPTLTVPGCTMSAASTNTVDASTTSGTDLRYRSVRYTVNSGTATGPPTYSLTLAGTTTNAVGVAVMARVRETTAAEVHTSTGSAAAKGSVSSLTTTTRTQTGTGQAKASVQGTSSGIRTAVAVAVAHAAATGPASTIRTTTGQTVAHASATGVAVVPHISTGTAASRGATSAQFTTTRATQGTGAATGSAVGVSATMRGQDGTAASVGSMGADVVTVRTATGQAVARAQATGQASGGTGQQAPPPEVHTVSAYALAHASIAAATSSLRGTTGTAVAHASATGSTTTGEETPVPTIYSVTVSGPGVASSVSSEGNRP